MKKRWRILLILVAVASFGIALTYPLKYYLEERSTEATMERLTELRDAGLAMRGPREGTREQTQEAEQAGKEGAEESGPQAEGERPEGTAPSASEVEGQGEEAEAAEARRSEAPAQEPTQTQTQSPAGETVGEAEARKGAEVKSTTAPEQTSQAANEAEARESAGAKSTAAPKQTSQAASEAQTERAPEAARATRNATGATPQPTVEAERTPEPTAAPTPAPTVDRFERVGAVPYNQKVKRTLDVDAILPQFREIYAENNDFAGWLTIPGTAIDYPVVQSEDSEFYLKHDFYGKKNANGQIILDTKCDPYTPSYNLVVSGHSMKSGKMFGRLVDYMYESFWEKHKLVYFDTLMEERTYVVLAAFFSADYDVDEEGFRYNADIQYSLDARQWLREVHKNELYDTGIEAGFGDEFLTLTTCNKVFRENGRFVVVCRRLREGEEIE